MSVHEDLFEQTFEIMRPGDCLIVVGGTFPGAGEEATVTLDLQGIVPVVDIFRTAAGTRAIDDEKVPYDNPLAPDPPKLDVTLHRKEGRFRFDAEDTWFRMGRRLGMIADHEVDIILVGEGFDPDFCFIAKP